MPFTLGGIFRGSVLLCALTLVACGGGGEEGGGEGDAATQSRTVTLTWDANRESGVNRAGGGYEVSIQVEVGVLPDGSRFMRQVTSKDVPYQAGPTAPTSTTVQLSPQTYFVSVRAYQALDPQGGSNRSFSDQSFVWVSVQ